MLYGDYLTDKELFNQYIRIKWDNLDKEIVRLMVKIIKKDKYPQKTKDKAREIIKIIQKGKL